MSIEPQIDVVTVTNPSATLATLLGAALNSSTRAIVLRPFSTGIFQDNGTASAASDPMPITVWKGGPVNLSKLEFFAAAPTKMTIYQMGDLGGAGGLASSFVADDDTLAAIAAAVASSATTVYAEDTAHTTGDPGIEVLGVRTDARASLCDTDGDYAPPQLTANGDMRVRDDDANTDLDTLVGAVHLEDAAHTTADPGFQVLSVRADARASLCDTDGDYAPAQLTANGDVRTRDDDLNTLMTTMNAKFVTGTDIGDVDVTSLPTGMLVGTQPPNLANDGQSATNTQTAKGTAEEISGTTAFTAGATLEIVGLDTAVYVGADAAAAQTNAVGSPAGFPLRFTLDGTEVTFHADAATGGTYIVHQVS